MAGPEGERRFDFEGEVVCTHPHAIVRTVHQESAGAHGMQPFERACHPASLLHAVEAEGRDAFRSDSRFEQAANRVLVRCMSEEDFEDPGFWVRRARLVLESRGGGFGGIKRFHDQIGGRSRPPLVA